MKKNLIKIGVGSLVVIGGIFLGRYIFIKIKFKKELLKDVDETVTSPLGEVKPFLLKVGSGMGSLSNQSKDVMKLQEIFKELSLGALHCRSADHPVGCTYILKILLLAS